MIHEILPSITTINHNNWHSQAEEVKKFNLKKVALFLTGLNQEERFKCFNILAKIPNLIIPFVHIRSDMQKSELQYLKDNFDTQYFSTHPEAEFPIEYDYEELLANVLVENVTVPISDHDLSTFSGLCLDLSHIETDRLTRPDEYLKTLGIIDSTKIIANHISGVSDKVELNQYGIERYDVHTLVDLKQLDYLSKYPPKAFAPLVAIELRNPIDYQLKVKEYITNILNNLPQSWPPPISPKK